MLTTISDTLLQRLRTADILSFIGQYCCNGQLAMLTLAGGLHGREQQRGALLSAVAIWGTSLFMLLPQKEKPKRCVQVASLILWISQVLN